MATLHLLSRSPFADNHLSSCLQLLAAGDALLLAGDAVYALRAGSLPRQALDALAPEIGLFALDEDIQARALTELPERAQIVDYYGFVELCCHYTRTNSWL